MRSLINRYYTWYFNLTPLKQFGVMFLVLWLFVFSFNVAAEKLFYHENESIASIAMSSIFSAFFMAVFTGVVMPPDLRKSMWEKKQKERNQKADQ